ncbi:putative flavin-containing amine oxidase [Aspergillus thermomutatus]|uniref:Amine oxidase n=1 Tax=Aspergillus thermomutatus TaxID=41047 RepID=A0A397HFT2_ASPTH|nr:uncharacterized protein CDV56_108160 [Aspergillus thermomutatus]RHZ60123.1 hypothetical protein CDV56_108160 [Aspergillus thermomutatus]
MVKIVETVDLSHTPNAYYAPATIAPVGKLIHVSGLPGSTKDGTTPSDYESQVHLALLNLRKVIIAAGSSVQNVVKLNLLIVNYDAANRKHTRHLHRFLGGHRPAITLIPVPKLAVPSWLFEIDAVIAVPEPCLPPSLPAARETVDVVIIGAGLAGLSAAHDVLRAGLSCIVLEARDRVGGKTWSIPLKDGKGMVDLGAAWINDTNQSKVYALAKRYGAEVIEQNTQGNAVLEDVNGHCSPFAYGELPSFDSATRENVAYIRDMCEADCQALDTWKPKDTTLDSLTFEAYLRSRGASDAALVTATVWTRAMLGQDPNDISALYFLNYCKSGGGLLQMRSDRKDGGQYLRIRQGTQVFALGLASSLPEGVVRLSSPVQSVVQNGGASISVQAGGLVYSGRKAITTVSTPALKNITFYPRLPPVKQTWIESTTYGYYTKAMMEFRSRSGEREIRLLEQLGKLFGVKNLDDEFVQMTMYEWSEDEFSGWGCPCTSLTPGVLDTLGSDSLQELWGNLHFAGTETAGEWKGYMEGAIRSGERAAAEVVKALNAGFVAQL